MQRCGLCPLASVFLQRSLCGLGQRRVRGLPTRPPTSSLQGYQAALPASEIVDLPFFFSVPEDLSLEEREELLDIRRRKKELIDDIEVKRLCVRICVKYRVG